MKSDFLISDPSRLKSIFTMMQGLKILYGLNLNFLTFINNADV